MNPNASSLIRLISHPLKFRIYLLWKLPAAFFSGVRVKTFTPEVCTVVVPFKWFSQNPFKSTYFACLAMAAEMSSGMLALAQVYKRKPAISMLVVKLEAQYHKKATSSTLFTCSDGVGFAAAIEQAVVTGEGVEFSSHSVGRNEKGELIAEFWIRWSFKAKS
jgi:hypothetical protein